MFTGIIEATAGVLKSTDGSLILERPAMFDDIKLGASICVSGVCLSIVAFDDQSMRFDVIDETLSKTTLGDLKSGDVVNLERALKVSDRFEGHIVQGHVEGTTDIGHWTLDIGVLEIVLPDALVPFVIEKGSIAIDGVSLTVASMVDAVCTVALIPHTLSNTTLGSLKTGDRVNIETDILGRYILSSRL
ncbi:riboflavin synthase [Candidatus Peribacteria bacterium]|nr:MAG: riboflavin synthase [Candidatus Peribacteria bacterium]